MSGTLGSWDEIVEELSSDATEDLESPVDLPVSKSKSAGDPKAVKLFLGLELEMGKEPCLGMVGGQGPKRFCIRSKVSCPTAKHRNATRDTDFEWQSNNLYVRGVNETAYCLPTVSSDQVDDRILEQWMKAKCTPIEWCQRFSSIQVDPTVASPSEVDGRLEFLKRMGGLKTPGRIKEWQDDTGKFARLDFVATTPSVRKNWIGATGLPPGMALALISLERGLEVASERVFQLETKVVTTEELLSVDLTGLGMRVSQIENLSGIQDVTAGESSSFPVKGSDNYESFRDDILKDLLRDIKRDEVVGSLMVEREQTLRAEFDARLLSELAPIKATLDTIRTRFGAVILEKIKTLERELVDGKTVTRQLVEGLREVQEDALTFRASSVPGFGVDRATPTDDKLADQLHHVIDVVNAKLEKFERDLRQDGVKFGGLGIGNFEEMQAWVDMNLSDNKFGCFVDGVSILQFLNGVYISAATELKTMESVEKLGMGSGQEAKVIMSFQNVLPYVFGGDDDVSKPLPALGTPEKWYDGRYGTGLKDQIRKGLIGIRNQFEAQIRLMRNERSQVLARSCLAESEHFIAGLSEYISNVFDELKHGGYDSKGAWILTCKLVRRIFDQIYNARVSGKDAKMRGNDATTTALILFATLKAHDVMREFVEANFENHPSIASEYVKFLTRNSMAGSIGDVVTAVSKMSDKVGLLESSKVTTKKSLDTLQTRVAALEHPKK